MTPKKLNETLFCDSGLKVMRDVPSNNLLSKHYYYYYYYYYYDYYLIIIYH